MKSKRPITKRCLSGIAGKLIDICKPGGRKCNSSRGPSSKKEFEVGRDEVMKLTNLPTWQAETLAGQIKPAKEEALFGFLVPALLKVRNAQGRLEQRIALLRHVEALRLYAAAHDGKLPVTLS